jgi:hypothetical protein
MNNEKNSLRQLATTITLACRDDGAKKVKQSTVLKTLTQSAHFHSIQASDAATKNTHTVPLVTDDVVMNRALLMRHYPSSDLLGFNLSEYICLPTESMTIEVCMDGMFFYLWRLVSKHYCEDFIDDANVALSELEALATALETQQKETLSDALHGFSNHDLKHFIAVESKEALDGVTPEDFQSSCIHYLAARPSEDITTVLNAFI